MNLGPRANVRMVAAARVSSGLVVALLIGLCASCRSEAQPAAPLVIERTIPLRNVSGRIDHLVIDPGRKRLFVAELGNGTVDAIDLATASVVHRIDGLKEPQGL